MQHRHVSTSLIVRLVYPANDVRDRHLAVVTTLDAGAWAEDGRQSGRCERSSSSGGQLLEELGRLGPSARTQLSATPPMMRFSRASRKQKEFKIKARR